VFSPDGRKIAFERYDNSVMSPSADIWVANANGTGGVNVTNTPATYEGSAAFSPDGTLLAFYSCDLSFDDCDIFASNVDGTARRPITALAGPVRASNPAFSPDGRRIAYGIETVTSRDIWTAGVDGAGAANLTNTPDSFEGRPNWSPDGQTIIFDSSDGMGFDDLVKVRSNGTGGTVFSATPAVDEDEPAFSPDGKRVALAQCPAAGCEIAVTPSSAFAPVAITSIAADGRDPDWQPIQRCGGRAVTILGDQGPDKIKGTKKPDVIAAFGGKDTILGRGGRDRICGGAGKDRISGGGGDDICAGGKGRDRGSCEKGKL
jgi:TolB protein